jgi:hypothetical protein
VPKSHLAWTEWKSNEPAVPLAQMPLWERRGRARPSKFLVDQSFSMNRTHRHDLYDYAHEVIQTLQPCERVIIETVIGPSTMADPELVLDVNLPNLPYYSLGSTSLWDDPRQLRDDCLQRLPKEYATFTKAVNNIDGRLRAMLENPPKSMSTSLLDGIAEAASNLEHEPGPKVLVVLSDSLEDSRDHENFHWDFQNPKFWDRNKVPELLARLKQSHRIPNLSGVKVYFVGVAARTPGAPASAPYVFSNSTAFWAEFFKATGTQELVLGHRPTFQNSQAQDFSAKERCGRS